MQAQRLMARRTLESENIRKLTQRGDSLSVTLPIAIIRKLRWRRSQKVVVTLRGERVTIQDWKRKKERLKVIGGRGFL